MTSTTRSFPPVRELALFLSLCFFWGTTWIGIKYSLMSLPPVFSVAIRFSLATACLVVLAAVRRERWPRRPARHVQLAFVGLCSFCLSYLLVYQGEQYISSGLTAVMFGTFPFFIAICSHFWIPGERLNAWKIGGVGFGFAGVAFLYAGDLAAGEAAGLGIVMVLGAALASAVSNVYGKRLLVDVPVVTFNAVAMAWGTAADWLAWILLERHRPVHLDLTGVLATAYLVIFGTVFPFVGYFWLLKRMDTTRVAMLTFITPVVALVLGWLILREPVTGSIFAGSSLILGGVLMTLKGSVRRHGTS